VVRVAITPSLTSTKAPSSAFIPFCADGKLAVSTKGDQSKDIFRDLIGYSLIAIGMLEREENP
jgi:hypothetical protein